MGDGARQEMAHSDYIVFVDESGDHGLTSIDSEFPVFALCFCLIKKADYVNTIVPAFQQFKFDFWGHDSIVLHERDIRKSKGPFSVLMTNAKIRASFYERLNALMNDAPMTVFASIIDKRKLKEKYTDPMNPYEIAMLFCMERLLDTLLRKGQVRKRTYVMLEGRGKKEDRELELEFRRICDNKGNWGYRNPDFRAVDFQPIFVSKAANSTGLQLADLVARPIALNYLRPRQENRAMDIIRTKLGEIKRFP